MIMNMVGGSGEVKPSYKVYGFEVDMTDDTKEYPVSYPKNIFGQLNGASFIETPAYGTGESCMNDWADCPLITGIKRQIGNSVSGWQDITDKRAPVLGTDTDDVMTYIPTWYMRIESSTRAIDGTDHKILTVAFSAGQLDSNWKDYAGSVGQKRVGHFRIGCYGPTYNSTNKTIHSKGGTLSGSLGYAYAQARGEGYDGYTVYMHFYLTSLLMLLYKSVDLSSVLSPGRLASDAPIQEALTYVNDFGFAGDLSGDQAMSVFWIQDLWGLCRWEIANISTTESVLKLGLGYCTSNAAEMEFNLGKTSFAQGYVSDVVGTTEGGFIPTAAVSHGGSGESAYDITAFMSWCYWYSSGYRVYITQRTVKTEGLRGFRGGALSFVNSTTSYPAARLSYRL